MRRVQLQGGARRPHARRTSCTLSRAAEGANFLGGGLRPPSETSPQDSLRRQSRRSKVEHSPVEGEQRIGNRSAEQSVVRFERGLRPRNRFPGGGIGGGRRGPLRWNAADGPSSSL